MKRLIIVIVAIIVAAIAFLAKAYVPTIREDRVWCYSGLDFSEFKDPDWKDYLVIHYIHFDGTVEVGDKTYHRAVLFKTVRYEDFNKETQEHYSGSYLFYDERERNMVLYYLREENGKVYQLRLSDDNYEEPVRTLPENPNPLEYIETLLYDWTRSEGYIWDAEGTASDLDGKIIHYGDNIDIDGECCRCINFEEDGIAKEWDFQIVEGIGPLYYGSVGEYFINLPIGNYMDSSDYPREWSYLKCVYNGEGKLIYGEEVKLADGVNDIITDKADDTEAPVYDLMGRRVTNLLPGSVYIRNGRKFIGK